VLHQLVNSTRHRLVSILNIDITPKLLKL